MNNLISKNKFLKIFISIIILFFLQCNADQYPYYIEEMITNFDFTGYNFSIIVDSSGSMITDMSEIQSELYSLINAKSTNLQEIANKGNGQYYNLATSPAIGTIYNNIKNLADGWIETNE